MLKKLGCLFLCLVLLIPVFSACSKSNIEDDILSDAYRYTTTLNLWLIAEDGMDQEQAKAVNAAINKITKAKFKTQLEIKYLSAGEYYSAIEKAYADKEKALEEEKEAKKAALQAQREAALRGETIPETAESVVKEETILNEYGLPELKYPTTEDYQVDILFLGNFEKYREYADKEWLYNMDEVMLDSSGQLSYFVHEIFQTGVVYDGVTYAMPNNAGIGEYTFLVADEALMNEYACIPADFENSSIYDRNCYEFLRRAYKDGITPIYSASGKVDLSLVHYWNFDLDSVPGNAVLQPSIFSIYGTIFSNSDQRGASLGNGLILNNTNYVRRWKYKTEYETTPGFITTDETARTAVRLVKGGYELKEQYEKAGYTVMTMESPRATNETIYSSMYAIGAYASNPSRAMEIIAYINTNPELRNLLQYGIENVNYVLDEFTDEDGTVYQYATPTETNRYFMDITKTGNRFIAYPNSPESVKEWDYQKKQNLDAVTYPTLGFYCSPDYKINTEAVRIINAVSKGVEAYMNANLTDLDKVNEFFAKVAEKTSESSQSVAEFLLSLIEGDVVYNAAGDVVDAAKLASAMNVMQTRKIDEGKNALQSPYALYRNWLVESGYSES